MNIVNRRNAVIGYLALQALKRSRRNATLGYLAAQGMEHTRARRRNRRALKIAFYVVLGIASLGALAAAGAFAKRSRGGAEARELESTDAAPAEPATEPARTETVAAT